MVICERSEVNEQRKANSIADSGQWHWLGTAKLCSPLPPSLLSFTTMSPTSTTDTAPPPSYLFLEEFDRKTSQAMQNAPEVDEDDWEVYDPAAFEENDERSPPSSSSARILGSNTNRHGRRGRRRSSARVLPPTPLKVRS